MEVPFVFLPGQTWVQQNFLSHETQSQAQFKKLWSNIKFTSFVPFNFYIAMPQQKEHYKDLVRLLLPSELFEYFAIVNIRVIEKEVHVYLDEEAIKPEGFELVKLISKGFHPETIIQDFPLRDKAVFLHIRRRRWFSGSTGKVVERDWDVVSEGTRYTKSFAVFLKGLFGHLPHKFQ